jgi:hypothetical protein
MEAAELATRLKEQVAGYQKLAAKFQELLVSFVGQLDETNKLLNVLSYQQLPPAPMPTKKPRLTRRTLSPEQVPSGCDEKSRGGCSGPVAEVRCDHPGCSWSKRLCEAHGGVSLTGRAKGGHQRLHRKDKEAAAGAPRPFR